MPNMILPGTYIEVRDEGLISAGRITTGNIGIVGTAAKGPVNQVQLISSLAEAREIFGDSGEWTSGEWTDDRSKNLTLVRALTLIYKTGGRNVYAVRLGGGTQDSKASFQVQASGTPVLELEAITPGTWGNSIKISIDFLEISSTKLPVDRSTLSPNDAQSEGSGGSSSSENVNSDNQTSEPTPLSQIQSEQLPSKKRKAVVKSGSSLEEEYSFDSVGELADKIAKKSQLLRVRTSPSSIDRASVPEPILETNFSDGSDFTEPSTNDYESGLKLLENKDVNIVVLAGQSVAEATDTFAGVLNEHLNRTASNKRERIGIIGSGFDNNISKTVPIRDDGRLIFTAPGVLLTENGKQNRLPGGYLAAAVAGLISSLPVHSSPTNKVLSIEGLTTVFDSANLEELVKGKVCAVEQRNGFRIVKGITTSDGAWQQITTRRIVDYAIYGVRSSCDPYIGKLNNERVRGAMKATLDSFLTRMVEDEALVNYQLEVSATRAQEIAGEAFVAVTLHPTFSIDFIKVTMYLS